MSFTSNSPKKTRAEQNREAQQRRRERLRTTGVVKVEVLLTAEEALMFADLRSRQRGPLEDFAKRALITGALFTANSGNPIGKKVKKTNYVRN